MSSKDGPFEPDSTCLPPVSVCQSPALAAEAKMETARCNLPVLKDFTGEMWALYQSTAK